MVTTQDYSEEEPTGVSRLSSVREWTGLGLAEREGEGFDLAS